MRILSSLKLKQKGDYLSIYVYIRAKKTSSRHGISWFSNRIYNLIMSESQVTSLVKKKKESQLHK